MFSLFERRSRVLRRISWVMMICIICTTALVELRCIDHRGGYKCVVTSQDGTRNLKLEIKNIDSSSDIQVNAFKFVGMCRNTSEPLPFRGGSEWRGNSSSPRDTFGPGPSVTRKGYRLDESIPISKGNSKIVSLDAPPVNQCSVFITKSCHKSSGQWIDCRSAISIS